ncbi:MAG TPA: cytochrome d ubiquinol oxidase subunit II [Streptosporangiales bacterium]
MDLVTLWFVVVAFFWTGYLVLEGFDFGVGMLAPYAGRDAAGRSAALRTIGPVWDGNEVWLVVAVGATFAAFPRWYATMFSAYYLPMLLVLLALIARGVALEFRGKLDSARWRRWCDRALVVGSAVPAVAWGAVFATLVRGLSLTADGTFTGATAASGYAVAALGGAASGALFLLHGATFLALRTTGDVRARAVHVARLLGPVATAVVAGLLAYVQIRRGDTVTAGLAAGAVVALLLASVLVRRGRDAWAFAGTAAGVALTFVTVFAALFPDAVPSSLDPAWSLTVDAAAAQAYALRTMSVVAAVFAPLVLAYQAWSYWVFRRRVAAP